MFGPEAVDELLARRALRTPFLRMAQDGRTLDPSSYTLGGGVGATLGDQVSEDRVLRLFADGATIVLQALHRTWAPVVEAAQDLAADLGHPVQVNAYVTPPQNQGFDDHYDVHDVFVVQVAGEKHWRVRPPVLESPLRDQPWTDRRDAVRTAASSLPSSTPSSHPVTALYVPRGGCTRRRCSGSRASTSPSVSTCGPGASSRTTCSAPPGAGSTPSQTCGHPSRSASTRRTRRLPPASASRSEPPSTPPSRP